jgi:hypothetical protein
MNDLLSEIARWWQSLGVGNDVLAGAMGGFISAFVMFIISDVIWKSRVTKIQERTKLYFEQLNEFYAPLYNFYRSAYSRYDIWRGENPDTRLERQPFFEPAGDETYPLELFSKYSGHASPALIRMWSTYQTTSDKQEKAQRRIQFLQALLEEYHGLRRKLKLSYDREEVKSGTYIVIS